MKALWKVEVIGYAPSGDRRTVVPKPGRPWLAEITGLSARYGLRREFMPGQVDFEDMNSRGTRGIQMHWVLAPGRMYEAEWSTSWRQRHRAFLKVVDGRIEHIERKEVEAWLRQRLNVSHVSGGSASTS